MNGKPMYPSSLLHLFHLLQQLHLEHSFKNAQCVLSGMKIRCDVAVGSAGRSKDCNIVHVAAPRGTPAAMLILMPTSDATAAASFDAVNRLIEDAARTAPGSIVDLPIPGVWAFVPQRFTDERGSFHEAYRADQFTDKLGYPFVPAQANLSRSRRGVIRGIHLADVPPGQAKFVTCVAGQITDVIVDLRVGSPTFGRHIAIDVSAENAIGVHVPLGVGHGFVARSEEAVVSYLVTEAYNPDAEWGIHPLDATLGIDWGVGSETADAQPILSEKDRSAPAFDAAAERLPRWREVRGWEQELRRGWALAMEDAENWSPEASSDDAAEGSGA